MGCVGAHAQGFGLAYYDALGNIQISLKLLLTSAKRHYGFVVECISVRHNAAARFPEVNGTFCPVPVFMG